MTICHDPESDSDRTTDKTNLQSHDSVQVNEIELYYSNYILINLLLFIHSIECKQGDWEEAKTHESKLTWFQREIKRESWEQC